MLRSKASIEMYANLLGLAYSMCITLPFINDQLAEYKFKSPQELKYYLSDRIIK